MLRPIVYVYCPRLERPTGGAKLLYSVVDVLRSAGAEAFALHGAESDRYQFFENNTPFALTGSVRFHPADLVVVPEYLGTMINHLFRGQRKIVFNQNCYYTFRHHEGLEFLEAGVRFYQDEVIAHLVVSEDSKDFLNFAFPGSRISRLRHFIDGQKFKPAERKKDLIAFMPRKNGEHASDVLCLLYLRRKLGNFSFSLIDDQPEQEVARLLGQAKIFLSFGFPEGSPLPPLEAMAAGCVTVGYHGRGGREDFDPRWSFPVEYQDLVGLAETVERIIASPEQLRSMGELARQKVLEKYSLQHHRQDIVEFFRPLEVL